METVSLCHHENVQNKSNLYLAVFYIILNVPVRLFLHSQSITGSSAYHIEVDSQCELGMLGYLRQMDLGAQSRRYSKNDCYR